MNLFVTEYDDFRWEADAFLFLEVIYIKRTTEKKLDRFLFQLKAEK